EAPSPRPAGGGGAKDTSTAPTPAASVSPGTADPRLRRLVLRLSPAVAALAGESASPSLECAGSAEWGDGEQVAVEYDGRLGALVYRAPEGQQQQVELYLCGVSGPVRTVVVPLP
ncbi:MAG TPA: hypothetical protein PLP61_13505, partial [Nocardioides sp.]|uniref:hypothetical protein n=1 Tax=Nocardioides sp. TaxID=35761 RepID=UPI002CE95489